ncbi:MAG: 23S rRNA (pseudouridine(1915)-N(3))-methyltransferase RlmH [Gammaproteobacteria bacterium]|nr:23S rRNA (pseudouridine(1915)-N(3))-methyltransferase RlmH [Gammaproteobacteria bacterium]
MHLRLIAVGDRQPGWVDEAFSSYVARFPANWKFRLDSIPTGQRGQRKAAASAVAEESGKMLQRLDRSDFVVALDEGGRQLSSDDLALRLQRWQTGGRDLAFLIGGPDGLGPDCLGRADFCWSLSRVTLPHGLARILLVEQLYRAWSINQNHPYHRC